MAIKHIIKPLPLPSISVLVTQSLSIPVQLCVSLGIPPLPNLDNNQISTRYPKPSLRLKRLRIPEIFHRLISMATAYGPLRTSPAALAFIGSHAARSQQTRSRPCIPKISSHMYDRWSRPLRSSRLKLDEEIFGD